MGGALDAEEAGRWLDKRKTDALIEEAVAQRDKRIRQLEHQCATLAAEVDRQRSVVQAAQQWHMLSKYRPEHYFDYEQDLANAVAAYEASREGMSDGSAGN